MKMGCCFSCNDDDEVQGVDSGERTQLLRDPVQNATPVVRVPHSEARLVNPAEETLRLRGQEDELARILQETASAMIDVTGPGSHSLDQREFHERSRQYVQKVQVLSPLLIKSPSHLLYDVPNPEKYLGATPIPQEDIDLMDWATEEVGLSLNTICVEHTEDLVVPLVCMAARGE